MKPCVLVFVACACLCSNAFGQSTLAAIAKTDSLFASYNPHTPGAAVAIVKDGKVIHMGAYGMADLGHDIPITPRTVFNIASVSKQFTAFAIYLLERERKISLTDDVRKYIPELPDYGSIIRIKHLLAHTSGLRDQAALGALAGGYAADVSTTEMILKLLVKQRSLNYPPGTTFNYNNTGYTLLAEIIHRVTGKSFAEYTNENIFKPLAMTHTRFVDDYSMVIRNTAESYELINDVYYRKPLNTSNAGPSNLFTTVEDLTKWVLNFENPIVGNQKLIQSFNEASRLDNGNKVILRVVDGDTIFHAKGQNLSTYNGLNMITHGGHAGGFRTFLGRFPDQHFSIIALSNDEHNESLRARWQIADFFLKDKMVANSGIGSTSSPNATKSETTFKTGLSQFEGTYYNDELETSYVFEVSDGTLVMKHIRLSDVILTRRGEATFSGSGDNTFPFEMEFIKSKNGSVTEFTLSNFGVKNMKFTKVR